VLEQYQGNGEKRVSPKVYKPWTQWKEFNLTVQNRAGHSMNRSDEAAAEGFEEIVTPLTSQLQ
jgi:hypothetical protein